MLFGLSARSKYAGSTQLNELRRLVKVSATGDPYQERYGSRKFATILCAVASFKNCAFLTGGAATGLAFSGGSQGLAACHGLVPPMLARALMFWRGDPIRKCARRRGVVHIFGGRFAWAMEDGRYFVPT